MVPTDQVTSAFILNKNVIHDYFKMRKKGKKLVQYMSVLTCSTVNLT